MDKTIAPLAWAAAIGVVAALVLSRSNITSIKSITERGINNLTQSHPLAGAAMATAMGMAPVYSRAFPDRSNLFNSLPSPMVEHNVPFDVAGRFANITGAYDRCDAVTFP